MNCRYAFIALSIVFLNFQHGIANAANTDDFAQFRIKVELSKMLADRARVQCRVTGNRDTADGYTEFVLNRGAFRGVVTVHLNLRDPKDPGSINKWRCNLMLFKNGQWKGLYNNNAQSEVWLHSRPASRLVWDMEGKLRTPQASVAGHGVSARIPNR